MGFGGDLDAQWHISAQQIAKRKLAAAFVKLGKVESHKSAYAGQHARGAAQLKIGTPDIFPMPHECHAAGNCCGPVKAALDRFGTQHLFQTRNGDQKNLEGGVGVHGARSRGWARVLPAMSNYRRDCGAEWGHDIQRYIPRRAAHQ